MTETDPSPPTPSSATPSSATPPPLPAAPGVAAPGEAGGAQVLPAGAPALRTIAMPGDANPNGDIFGGWLLSQMDLAGSVVAYERAGGRIATVAVDAMTFLKPVFIGDLVSCYARIVHVGRTSIRVLVDTFVRRRQGGAVLKVTEGTFTFVAIDEQGRPRTVPAPDVPGESGDVVPSPRG